MSVEVIELDVWHDIRNMGEIVCEGVIDDEGVVYGVYHEADDVFILASQEALVAVDFHILECKSAGIDDCLYEGGCNSIWIFFLCIFILYNKYFFILI